MSFHSLTGFLNFAFTVPLFERLDKEELEILFQTMDRRVYHPGDMIVVEDSKVDNHFFIIYSGRVKVLSINEEGDERVYSILEGGSFFGEMSLLEEKPRSASVIALTECRLYILSSIAFFRMLELFPLVTVSLLRCMSSRLREVNQYISNNSFMTSPERVRHYLYNLGVLRGRRTLQGTIIIENMPKQSEIAQLINCTRETVSREMTELKKKDVIKKEKSKRLVILDEHYLQN